MNFEYVDDYYRQEHFDYFSAYGSPFYGLTLNLDITEAKAYAETHEASIYLLLCYLVTRAANTLEDFHYRVFGGRIVRYERLDLSATVPAPGGRFSFAFFDFHPDTDVFLEHAKEASLSARESVSLAEREHFNQLLFTAAPSVPFTHFTHPERADHSDARPNIAFGAFIQETGRLKVPVGFEFNHIFIDGRALESFLRQIQHEFDHPQGAA